MATLKKQIMMRCSAKKVVLGVGILLGLRLLWAAIFPPSSTFVGDAFDQENRDSNALDLHEQEQQQIDDNTEQFHKGLEYRGRQFFLNGKPFRIIGGSFHYFRTRPEQWEDRLKRMKAAGLNTVTTYVAWNVHERLRGTYNFSAEGYDLFQFISLVQKTGFYMILRPGPYICAEWEFGGFPSWLLHDPRVKLRTSKYKSFMTHVERLFKHLIPTIKKYTFRRGGPIIAFQVENEFGSYSTSPDPTYLNFIAQQFQKHGIKELLLTSDGPDNLSKGTLPGVLPTVNFNSEAAQKLKKLLAFGKGKYPLMVTEFWPGWFDHWGEKHNVMTVTKFNTEVEIVLSYNASINFYMFTGGTNFGFWNGANMKETYAPTITSYDYDALISECGDVHPTKYKAFRDLLVKFNIVEKTALPPIPENPRKVAYGVVKLQQSMTLDKLCELSTPFITTLKEPVFMEFLNVNSNGGQGYGWILYRAQFHGRSLKIEGIMHDRAQIFVNDKLVDTIYNPGTDVIRRSFFADDQSGQLNILVENMGRVNYQELDNQRKGFMGIVTVDGERIEKWDHIPLDFSDDFITRMRSSKNWNTSTSSSQKVPTLYRGFLEINHKPEDTFLDMSTWTKGIVLVNGFLVGRYWNIGPQQTLYIPWPLLQNGSNEIAVFELEKPASGLTFVNEPILSKP